MANTITSGLAYQTKLQSILSAYKAKQAALFTTGSGKPDNPADWNKPKPRDSSIRSFSQNSTDTITDTLQTSRSIGDLTGGKTRLNVFSAMTPGDRVDFYNFNVTTAGKAGISINSDEGVHVQLLKRNGTVVADSEATIGAKADNWKDFQATKLYLDKDQYFLKVTRSTGALLTSKPNYAIQLSMGTYFTEDYQTIETAAAPASSTFVGVGAANTGGVSSVLNQLAGGSLFDFLA